MFYLGFILVFLFDLGDQKNQGIKKPQAASTGLGVLLTNLKSL